MADLITIQAQGVFIELEKGSWMMFKDVPLEQRGIITYPLLQAMAGTDVLHYQGDFGQQVGLPGDRLSTHYIRAILIGYAEKTRQWVLGIHVAKDETEKPVFKVLVRWPSGDSNTFLEEVRQTARHLSLIMGRPMKVFGEKKLPAVTNDPLRSGITGPLEPHMRERIESQLIRQTAKEIALPIKGDHFNLSKSGNGYTLKIGKPVQGDVENPVFNLCEINIKQGKLKLVAPTGLLNLLGPRGKEYLFKEIRNIEYRYIQGPLVESVPSEDGKYMTEMTTRRHLWGIYLTLSDESLLLVQSVFTQSARLLQSRVDTVAGGNKLATNSAEGMRYFQEHLAEQEAIEAAKKSVEQCAYVMANAVNCHLVVTETEL